jgi:hypothetical protein
MGAFLGSSMLIIGEFHFGAMGVMRSVTSYPSVEDQQQASLHIKKFGSGKIFRRKIMVFEVWNIMSIREVRRTILVEVWKSLQLPFLIV